MYLSYYLSFTSGFSSYSVGFVTCTEDPWNIDAYLVRERAHVYSMELRDPQAEGTFENLLSRKWMDIS